jgi:hypothetical protein
MDDAVDPAGGVGVIPVPLIEEIYAHADGTVFLILWDETRSLDAVEGRIEPDGRVVVG